MPHLFPNIEWTIAPYFHKSEFGGQATLTSVYLPWPNNLDEKFILNLFKGLPIADHALRVTVLLDCTPM